MGEWHLSKYNIFTKPSNCNFIIGFNLLKGSRVVIHPDELDILYSFKNFEENNTILKKFKERGFIVNYNEIAFLESMNKYIVSLNKTVNITLCPTIGCNFDCTYCFQKHKNGKMSEEIQNKVIDLIIKMLDTFNAKGLNITWFGGEPLLAPEIIDSLSQKLIKITEDRKIFYSASIITNGYLLNQKNADMLAKNKVVRYQITIDGIGETHNKTRHLINNDPTFEVITENLRTNKIIGKINVRHNIYNDNKQDIFLLKKLVKNLKEQSGNNIQYYPAIVAHNPANHLDEQINYLNEKDACEIAIMRDVSLRCYKGYFCGAEALNCLSIDSEGRLYKCWEDIDKPERSFGFVNKWEPRNPFNTSDNLNILISYYNLADTFKDEECLNCILLPFCVGACPSKRMYSYKNCPPYKNNIDKFAEKLAEKYLKNIKKKNE